MLRWLTGRRRQHREEDAALATACAHPLLVSRWDKLEDIGKAERISSYRCETCGAALTRDEGEAALERGARSL